eukprot:c25403_g3_i2 orf=3-209(-)
MEAIRTRTMKKQGSFFSEEDNRFRKRIVRAAVEKAQRQSSLSKEYHVHYQKLMLHTDLEEDLRQAAAAA